ncbi:hypothetical protein Mgra_00005176 [Meloidogyne graminicola]|uniref:Uncharacterized protein n=1 Tax=Meloidogyne graminicola TaxID=189291 RepID=A0A8S9ZPI3_9BILA|nr:hypothetical protein Mgra_00005176 [Meloidogyne graminicola]
MEEVNGMNLLTAELQIEEIFSFEEVRYLIPILIKMIQTGELTFKSDFNFKFNDAFEFIKNDLGDKAVQLLRPENADNGDKQEIANIVFALLFIFQRKEKGKFDQLCEKLDGKNVLKMKQMYFLLLLNQKGRDEEINQYKIKAAEFEAKYKQIEAINDKLNEQLGSTQNEFIDLENKLEKLKQAEIEKQGTIDLLTVQLREVTDELETSHYNNSQLQRELKSLNERNSRALQKSANDLKSKEDEVRLLYIRVFSCLLGSIGILKQNSKLLDALVKQITEKDVSENKLKFLEQQIANQQGTIGELRIGLEQALDRANITKNAYLQAETELIKYRRLHNNNIKQEITNYLENSSDHIASQSGEFAKLKTRLELIQYEKRELEKSNEEFRIKLDEINNSQSQTILEKAKEIERFKQECEAYQNELNRTHQKEANLMEKNKNIEGRFGAEWLPIYKTDINCLRNFRPNVQLKNNIKRLEESIDKAAQVICEYSNAYGEQQCSAVDYLQLKHELSKLQTENERLISKMDQLRHEATQEQRLITQHWYQSTLNIRTPLLRDKIFSTY